MCGRFVRTSPGKIIAAEFGVVRFTDADMRPRYNIAPRQLIDAIIRDGEEKRLEPMRWGFMASFAKDPKLAPINARAETVATSPFFRGAFRHQRCLIVADGFYEWRKEGRRKTPYFIHLRSGRPFGFAGIWSANRNDAGTPFTSCAIVTCTPNDLMAPIHNRMPVILPAAARDRWLDPSAGAEDLSTLLAPLPSEEMEAYTVSTVVNSPLNDSPACVRRVTS